MPQQLCTLRLLVTNLNPSKALVHTANACLADLLREEVIEEKEESSGERMATYCTCNAYYGPQAVCAKPSMFSLWDASQPAARAIAFLAAAATQPRTRTILGFSASTCTPLVCARRCAAEQAFRRGSSSTSYLPSFGVASRLMRFLHPLYSLLAGLVEDLLFDLNHESGLSPPDICTSKVHIVKRATPPVGT